MTNHALEIARAQASLIAAETLVDRAVEALARAAEAREQARARLTSVQRAAALEYQALGHSTRTISACVGLSQSRVVQILRR